MWWRAYCYLAIDRSTNFIIACSHVVANRSFRNCQKFCSNVFRSVSPKETLNRCFSHSGKIFYFLFHISCDRKENNKENNSHKKSLDRCPMRICVLNFKQNNLFCFSIIFVILSQIIVVCWRLFFWNLSILCKSKLAWNWKFLKYISNEKKRRWNRKQKLK